MSMTVWPTKTLSSKLVRPKQKSQVEPRQSLRLGTEFMAGWRLLLLKIYRGSTDFTMLLTHEQKSRFMTVDKQIKEYQA